MPLITAGTVVLGERVCRPGWVQTAGARITGCGHGTPPTPADDVFPEATVVPGFVDMHVHGGGGASYTEAADTVGEAAAFHRRHGTTGGLASLVTAAPGELRAAVRVLAEATRTGLVDGIHLEGPWLSAARCGAHDPALLRAPEGAEIDELLTAGDGTIRMVTLAPELPGAGAAIRRFVDANVVVAVGHSDATYAQTRQAINAGVTVGTHLFNAMRPLHHREPGPALALLEDRRVTVELIADGVHVHPALIRHVIEAAGPDRVALVTDAMAAAGSADGTFRLGGLDVDVSAGVAHVHGTSTLAGSTATMDQLFRTAIRQFGATLDARLVAAARMTATTPARALGLADAGELSPGARADLVVLDPEMRVTRVLRRGVWLPGD